MNEIEIVIVEIIQKYAAEQGIPCDGPHMSGYEGNNYMIQEFKSLQNHDPSVYMTIGKNSYKLGRGCLATIRFSGHASISHQADFDFFAGAQVQDILDWMSRNRTEILEIVAENEEEDRRISLLPTCEDCDEKMDADEESETKGICENCAHHREETAKEDEELL